MKDFFLIKAVISSLCHIQQKTGELHKQSMSLGNCKQN